MDTEQIEGRIRQLFRQHLGVDEGAYRPHALIVEDLGADSLDIVELVIAFEEAFDITIRETDVQNVKTVGDAVAHVNECLLARPAAVAGDN